VRARRTSGCLTLGLSAGTHTVRELLARSALQRSRPDGRHGVASYATLQTAIGDFLNRDDLTSVAPTFIQLAEAQINRDVRHWRMEASTTISANAQFESLPASRQAMQDKRTGSNDVGGVPRFYAHTAGQLEIYPTPDDTYTLTLDYLAKIPALSDSNTSNWLLTNAPDVYLYGSLLHSAPYLVEDPRLQVWAQLYSAAVARLNDESEQARLSGSGLTMKVRGLG